MTEMVRWPRLVAVSLVSCLLILSLPAGWARANPGTPIQKGVEPSDGNTTPTHDGQHVLVSFAPNAGGAERASAHAAEQATVVNRMEWANLDVVRVAPGRDPDEVSQRYLRNPNVRFAEPNWVVSISATGANDTYYSSEWGLDNTGQSIFDWYRGMPDADIDAPEAWELAYGAGVFPTSGGVRVGVLDTGIDQAHEDLLGKTKACARAITGVGLVEEGLCYDDHGHGTHVAGTITATTNNGVGVAGVASDAEVAAFKFLDYDGYGQWADAIAGLRWLRTTGQARIINMSFGGGDILGMGAMDVELTEAAASGTLLIAAAGNDGCYNCYSTPASHPDVVSVAATDAFDYDAWFSNCNDDVEIAAPGVDVVSAFPGSQYAIWSGTSMATPHVVGAAALLMSEKGTNAAETRSILTSTTDDLGATGRDICYGFGRLNLFRALGGTPVPPPAPGSISGFVLDQSKNPIYYAQVECGGYYGYAYSWDGSYRIDNIPPGTYTCTATADGFRSKSQRVSVTEGSNETANFTLRKGSQR